VQMSTTHKVTLQAQVVRVSIFGSLPFSGFSPVGIGRCGQEHMGTFGRALTQRYVEAGADSAVIVEKFRGIFVWKLVGISKRTKMAVKTATARLHASPCPVKGGCCRNVSGTGRAGYTQARRVSVIMIWWTPCPAPWEYTTERPT